MEGIDRHLRKSNPAIDILMMHFVDKDKIVARTIPDKIDEYCYENRRFIEVSSAKLP